MRFHKASNLRLFTAVLIPLFAAFLQWTLWPTLSPKTWIFLYPSVFFSASIGGLIGGIIATCVAVLLGVYVFIPPQLSWTIHDGGHALSIAIFISMGLSFSFIFERLNRSLQELQRIKDLELELEQKRLSQALQAANAGIWEWFPDTNRNEWSDTIWQLYGIEPYSCQPSYESWLASVHPYDKKAVEKSLVNVLEQRTELNLEWRVANTELGKERWLLARGMPEFNVKGELLLYRGIVIDITERKLFEGLLQKNEERLNFALETLQAGAWELDLKTFVAQRTLLHDQIFGYTALLSEWNYPLFLEHVLPEDKSRVDASFRFALDNKTDWSFVCRIRRVDGEIRWISAKGRFSYDTALEQATFCRGIVQDITDSKRTELALVEKERHLVESQAVAQIGSWERHIQSGRVIWSEETFRLMGLSAETNQPPTFDKFLELVHPDDRPAVTVWHEDCLAGKQPPSLAYRTYPKHGPERWLLRTGKLEKDPTGQPDRIIGTVQDITESKRLLAEKQRWADAFSFCAHGIVIGNPQTDTIVTSNDAFACMLGYDCAKDVEGIPILSIYHPEHRELVKTYIQAADLLGKTQYESIYLRKDATNLDVHVDLVSVKDLGGKILYRVATIQNITERKRAKEELEELNAELEYRVETRTEELATLNQSLESFVYSVSHDLKTPLRGIEGYSRLLQQDYDSVLEGEGKLFLQNISDGIKRMNDLINDLLAYSRMSRRILDDQAINLNGLLDELLAERSRDISTSGVQFDISLPTLVVYADEEGLSLVLRNLLENALKFSQHEPKPHIQIGAKQDENTVTLWIRDNGIGFDMKYVSRIFEIFQRLHRLEDYPGTGIGLALVKTAMQRMNGNVWAESEPGRGATFFLELQTTKSL